MDNFIYLANEAGGLLTYSINKAGTLTYIDGDDQTGNYNGVWSDGTFIYVANSTQGLQTYSMDAEGNLTFIDSDLPAGGAVSYGVWGDGDYIYLANGLGGLHTYTVDGAGALTHVDSDDQGGTAYDVWGDGDFVYLANGALGIQSYSVAAGVLTLEDTDLKTGDARGVWGDGSYIYLAHYTGGLHTYSIDAAGDFTWVDSDDQGGLAHDVWGDGSIIYLANDTLGLLTYTQSSGILTYKDADDQGGLAKKVVGDSREFIYLANDTLGLLTYTANPSTGVLAYIDADTQGDLGLGVWALPELNFSHWEGWQSETSFNDAENKTTDALRILGPGLNLPYVHGGDLAAAAQLQMWAYNPVTAAWDTGLTGSSSSAQRGAGLSDGINIWTLRGEEGSGNQEYNIAGDSWTSSSAITAARQDPAYSDGFDDKAIVSHGGDSGDTAQDDCYSFPFSTETWATEAVDTGINKKNTSGFSDWNDTHWAIAGAATPTTTRKYSIVGDSWSAGPACTAHTEPDCCSLHQTGRGYVMGGSDNPKLLESLYFAGDSWYSHALSTSNHRSPQLIPWDNQLHAVAGSSGTANEIYAHAADSWSAGTVTPSARDGSRGGSHDQHIQNRTALVNGRSQRLVASGLTVSTLYYFHLWTHDRFYGP